MRKACCPKNDMGLSHGARPVAFLELENFSSAVTTLIFEGSY